MTDKIPTQRLDKWLWYARFFKTRGLSAKVVTGSHMRVNGSKVSKAASGILVGDTLTFPQGDHIRVIEVVDLGQRRGPAPEAQLLYKDLNPIPVKSPEDKSIEPPRKGRPTKRDRRAILALRRSPLE